VSTPGEDGGDWLSYRDALEAVLQAVSQLDPEETDLEAALGRALISDLHARVRHPPWDNSAMDGFAVRSRDVAGADPDDPVELPVSDEVPAGGFPEGPLAPGTAVKVMTGAPVPEGATGVIRVEHTDGGEAGRVRIRRDSDGERNIRRAGEDVEEGQRLLRAGDEITPAACGVLAMNGFRSVETVRPPRVGILATGDELADFDAFDEVRAGRKVMNSNSRALAAQVRSAGGRAVLLGIARDTPESLRERLDAASEVDAVVSSAGVSVGEHDHVRDVLREAGMEEVFWRARIRPGSPLLFGLLPGARPYWGLPGNPVSAMVTFEVFVRPALRKMAGHRALERRTIPARTRSEIRTRSDLTHFLRVVLRDEGGPADPPTVELTGPQGSGILTSMTAADALLPVPEGTGALPAGTPVSVLPLREWRHP
jgi:molybdopterin molybdotransferase